MAEVDHIAFSVVIPVADEEKSLEELYSRLIKALSQMDDTFELIFVDDGSKDNSFDVLEKLHFKDRRVKVLQFRRNFGKSAALTAGFREAKGQIIVTIDADLQDVPEEISILVSKLKEGFDLVSSWRFKRKDPLLKRVCSKIYNKTVSVLTGIRIHDFNSGLKCYRRQVLEEINIFGGMHRYILVLAAWKGFKIGQVKVTHCARLYGHSKYGIGKLLRGFFDLLAAMMVTKYSQRPFHVFGLFGFVVTLAGLGINLYMSIGWFFQIWIKNRPLLFLGMLLMIVGLQIIFFGLLCEIVMYSSNKNEYYSLKKRLR